jgi:hypothetical protein
MYGTACWSMSFPCLVNENPKFGYKVGRYSYNFI